MYYGSAENFKSYFAERGFTVPETWTDAKINSALLLSSEWLDANYDSVWIGYKVTFDQERAWPRQNAMVLSYPSYTYNTNEIPEQVIYATYELAKRELTNPGCLYVDYNPTRYTEVSVYNAVTVKYDPNASSVGDFQMQIPVVQNLMSLLIDTSKNADSNSMSGRAVRG